jgi:hypothetical protein
VLVYVVLYTRYPCFDQNKIVLPILNLKWPGKTRCRMSQEKGYHQDNTCDSRDKITLYITIPDSGTNQPHLLWSLSKTVSKRTTRPDPRHARQAKSSKEASYESSRPQSSARWGGRSGDTRSTMVDHHPQRTHSCPDHQEKGRRG